MIAVRIPEEIRKYKEKIVFGLTARQLACTALALAVCVPLYWFGRRVVPGNILAWLIILIALPVEAVGFVKINGMPFERFIAVFLESELLYPVKRVYKTENIWRMWQEEAERLEQAGGRRGKGPARGKKRDAEGAGNKKAPGAGARSRKAGRSPSPRGSEVEARMRTDPHYIPAGADRKALKSWKKGQAAAREKEERQAGGKKAKPAEKRRKAKSVIPRSTQQSIPYLADYEEGVFEVEPNKYSRMYRLKDINYRTAKDEEQENIFCRLGEFYNYFPEDMRLALCIDNRVVSVAEQERKVFKQLNGDRFDRHRKEYNSILRRQIADGRNDMQIQKYITVTIDADSPIDAILRFHKIDAGVISNLRRIGSDGEAMSTEERLEYYHDKYRAGCEGDFKIDFDFIRSQGVSSKDYIAPSWMSFGRRELRIGEGYYRVMFLNNLPASLQDDFLVDLCSNDFPVVTNITIEPVAQDKALRIVRRQLTGIEANKIDAEKRAIRAGYSPETIQHSIKDAYAQAEMIYDDLVNKNQKLFFVTIILMVYGGTPEELEANCKAVAGKARQCTAQLQVLTEQQEEGYKMALPFGYSSKKMCVERALTTESTAVFMPFANQELFQPGGYYYGRNQISQNLVIVDRKKLKTPSGFVLGSSGSGKSFATKREILNVLLDDDETNVLVIDPENEYSDFCRAFGGTVLKISATSGNHINPLDMPPDYGLDEDDDPESTPLSVKKDKALKKKSDYIMSIVERMISVGGGADATAITPAQKTIVDECLRETYRGYLDSGFDPERVPTLLDLQAAFDRAGETSPEAKQVADGVAYYTRGSMDLFAHRTNVRVDNRLVVFNVRDLGSQLQQIGQIIMFDFIWSRMVDNKNRGVWTCCYCDEIHTMFRSYYSADYLQQLYKRGRKYGLVITGVTQDAEALLLSEKARGMISNSDFILMLNQSSENLKVLAGMLDISEAQMDFVTGADTGSGLLFAEKVIVPFVDRFPQDSYLYRLMSTKFGEEMTKEEIEREIAEIMAAGRTGVPPAGRQAEALKEHGLQEGGGQE